MKKEIPATVDVGSSLYVSEAKIHPREIDGLTQRLRKLATIVAAISMLGFLFLYYTRGRPASLGTIALVDLIGLAPLSWAGWHAFQQ